MMAITLIACTAVFIMACIIFEDAPKYAPSRARQRSVSKAASAQQNQTTKEILKSYLRLISSKNFILLCVGYGLLVGSYYSLSGNINKLVTPNLGDDISQKDKSKHAGKMGLIMIVAGSVASLAAGCILDAAKKYKVSVCLLFWYIANQSGKSVCLSIRQSVFARQIAQIFAAALFFGFLIFIFWFI